MIESCPGADLHSVHGTVVGRWQASSGLFRGLGQGPRLLVLLAGVAFLLAGAPSPTLAAGQSAVERIKERGVLLWGSDAEGGAPYVFPDPKDPSKLIGFEVEIVEAVAKQLGVKARLVQTAWDSLIPALERGDYDMAMNGLEIIPQREKRVLFSRPYYAYTLQLMVRKEEDRIQSIHDLSGKKVGTLAGAVAHDMLQKIGGVDIRSYSAAWPYEDLALGRLDAVLLDTPIAAYYGKPDPRLKYVGPPEGGGFYGIAIRKADGELKQVVDLVIENLLRTGDLKRLYEKWGLWDEAQTRLTTSASSPDAGQEFRTASADAPLYSFLPLLLRGAGITITLSVVSMALAMALGLLLAVTRFYNPRFVGGIATAYVEIYRGTPLLIQLFIIYYGLPNIGIALSPLAAAIIGLGMNYAAYEAEVYRAGIEAVPLGQVEAALSLGMPRSLTFQSVIFPQAFRISLPAVTNDFIALFKDSSIVSVIAMVELTKTYGILAATTLRYFELGLVVAILYFGMSYPLSILARRIERRMRGAK
jgi:polar amino acid transport system permease protein/polar amino acid transport system substrate-binding protein